MTSGSIGGKISLASRLTPSPSTGFDTLLEAIKSRYALASLDTLVGSYYHVMIERMGRSVSTFSQQVCVVQDTSTQSVNIGKAKRGHDRIRKAFTVVGTDPLTIGEACRNIFDGFNRNPGDIDLDPNAGNLVGCRPTGSREVPIKKCRLPIPSGQTLLEGSVEVEFILTRGDE